MSKTLKDIEIYKQIIKDESLNVVIGSLEKLKEKFREQENGKD